MSHKKTQRTRIEDLSVNRNELFDLSEEMMMMVGGGYEGFALTMYYCTSTGNTCGGDEDACTDETEGCF